MRTREYATDASTKSITEIRVASILKLDRSSKQNAAQTGDQEVA